MTLNALVYPLQNGFIHHWLAAGPQASHEAASDASLPITATPADRDTFSIGGTQWRWNYVRCTLDHLVHLSNAKLSASYLQAWAYTQVKLPKARTLSFVLTTCGPADVWINGHHICRQEVSSAAGLIHTPFSAPLRVGTNEIVVRLQGMRSHAGRAVLALQITRLSAKTAAAIEIVIPTHAKRPDRHIRLEKLLEFAYLEDVVSHRGTQIHVRWSDEMGEELHYAYQIQDQQERIYVEGKHISDPANPLDAGHPFRIYERSLAVVLQAIPGEFYEDNLRYRRALPIHVLDNAYTDTPYGDFATRNQEALKEAIKFDGELFAEIAKMQLGLWHIEDRAKKSQEVTPKTILDAIRQVNERQSGSALLLLGLLGIAYRFLGNREFPEEVEAPLEACLKQAAFETPLGETEEILMSTVELLAGQRYPEHTFPSGQTGQWHRQHGEQQAIAWLKARGGRGFRQWNSNETFETCLAALAHLASLANDENVRALAAVVMDKIFFLMAVNSYKGTFGASHGHTAAGMVKSAQLEATSGIQRMMWGMGVYNHHIAGVVSLVCSGYEFPLLIASIATDQPAEMWNRECHQAEDGFEVHTATYKTPDYLLASATDYRAGQAGNGEHIWQATLGADAIVFVNHPGSASEDEAQPAGWWRGNAILPRVAQWKDALIAIHQLPNEDWMGFTHAFFPTFSFDEYYLQGGWAFARKGQGYLALTAQRGIELIKGAPDGHRELRSYGKENIWVCQMGRAALDGSFEDFRQKVLALPLVWQPSQANFTTLRGQLLTFGWQGPLQVDGQPQAPGSKHIENPYCTADLPAHFMDIGFEDYLMRLNFE